MVFTAMPHTAFQLFIPSACP